MKKMISDGYLSCATPGCKNTPSDITAKTAYAICEYQLRYNPRFTLNLECEVCRRRTKYTYEQIISLMPPEGRPKPLPHDHFWAFILLEVDTWKGVDNRAFVGDRVLVQRLHTEPNKTWYGTLKSTSLYAPSLIIGNYVKGAPWGRYEQCLFVIEDGNPNPIPRPAPIPRSSSFGMFLSPKQNDEDLLCANIFCSNPSCNHIFSTMTYKKFKELARRDLEHAHLFDKDSFPIVTLQCDVCGISRIIDERSFDGLFKEK